MILIFVFQGSRVFPRLWGDASVWLGVWPRPTTDHSRQPSTHAHNEPKPHPQLSHSVEVLLQRQLWLEGILRGEPLSAFLSVCRFARSMTTRPDALTLHTPIDCLTQLSPDNCNLFHHISEIDCFLSVCMCEFVCHGDTRYQLDYFVICRLHNTTLIFPSPNSPFLLPWMNQVEWKCRTVYCIKSKFFYFVPLFLFCFLFSAFSSTSSPPQPVVKLIEEASLRGLKEVRFITLQNQYILNIREGFQQNAVFGFRRQIKKRPMFTSSVMLTPHLQ